MDTLLDHAWTAETFLAWEDRQEGKHEFDGQTVIPMIGGSLAHQDIVFNIRALLGRLLDGQPFRAGQEMRLRIGNRVRYPDVLVCAGRPDQATRTLMYAIAVFEVLSDDTADTDKVTKLADYADVPSLRCYVILEQTAVFATLHRRGPDGIWITTEHASGSLDIPGLDVDLALDDIYRGLAFAA